VLVSTFSVCSYNTSNCKRFSVESSQYERSESDSQGTVGMKAVCSFSGTLMYGRSLSRSAGSSVVRSKKQAPVDCSVGGCCFRKYGASKRWRSVQNDEDLHALQKERKERRDEVEAGKKERR
jgi:hypothetical protein